MQRYFLGNLILNMQFDIFLLILFVNVSQDNKISWIIKDNKLNDWVNIICLLISDKSQSKASKFKALNE